MDEFEELLDSIPEKVIDPQEARKKLNDYLKWLEKHHKLNPLRCNSKQCQYLQTFCKVKEITKLHGNTLLPEGTSEEVKEAIHALQKLITEGKMTISTILEAVLENNVPLPTELLVMLQKEDVMQLTTYLLKYNEKYEDTSWFTDSLFWLVKNDQSKQISIVPQVLSSLLAFREAVSLKCGSALATLCCACTDKFCTQVTDWVLELPEENSLQNDLNYLSALEDSELVGRKSIRFFALDHLLKLISPNPAHRTLPMIQVPSFQSTKWKLSSTSAPLRSLLNEIVMILGADEVLELLKSALRKAQINWRIILLLASALLNLEGGAEALREFTDERLKHGLECNSDADLGASILLARQGCFEASSEFGSYSQWFGAHFGPGTATAKNSDQFRSLLQFLTDLVPVEPAAVLRVHLNVVPKAPTLCHAVLRDYTTLARSRLIDLNEPAEIETLFVDNIDDNEDSRAKDVGRVLQHFSQTGKVLKVVLEAAVFRRKYYEGVFLVELLQLPGWSRKPLCPEESGARHDFIEKLKSMDKIPEKLYCAYKGETDKEKLRKMPEEQTPRRLTANPFKEAADSTSSNKGRLQIKKAKKS